MKEMLKDYRKRKEPDKHNAFHVINHCIFYVNECMQHYRKIESILNNLVVDSANYGEEHTLYNRTILSQSIIAMDNELDAMVAQLNILYVSYAHIASIDNEYVLDIINKHDYRRNVLDEMLDKASATYVQMDVIDQYLDELDFNIDRLPDDFVFPMNSIIIRTNYLVHTTHDIMCEIANYYRQGEPKNDL